jgi:Ran GTPase-activating protein (RanGAP) involved in mRNA processing and transport
LQKLNISNNNIRQEGAMHVAGALRENSTLQHLDFSCNRIQNEGETYMAYAIQGHPSLSSITFGDGASAATRLAAF